MPLRQHAARHPVFAGVACAASQFLLTVGILVAGRAWASPAAFGQVKLLAFASTVLFPLLLVPLFGLWRRVGLAVVGAKPSPVFLASLLVPALFLSMGIHRPDEGGFAGQAGMQLVNAFGEELLFRGVIFALLLTLPRWQGIVLSGVLFGCMHLIHGVMDGNWAAACGQAAVTAMAGMMFAAVRYRSASLWPVVVLHMTLNLCMIYSNIEVAAGPLALLVVERLANVLELALAGYVIIAARTRTAVA